MTKERYQIFDGFIEGVQVLAPDGTYLYLNDAVAEQGKRPKEELLDSNIKTEYPGIETTEVYTRIQDCINKKERQIITNEFTYPDNSVGHFMLRMEPIEEGVLIMSMDITDVLPENEQPKT